MNGTVEVVASVADAFASLLLEVLIGTPGPEHPPRSLFLSGGPTARSAYQTLADRAPRGGPIDWRSIDVYWGDERCVPLDDPESNHRLCQEALLDHVGPTRSDNPMYRSGPPEAAAAEYQALLAPLPDFDIVHLGMGPDGHTASLFPDTPVLGIDDEGTLVVATRDPHANNPHDRLTLTFPAISRARLVVVTVSGESKRKAWLRLLADDDLPAGRLAARSLVWLVDHAASGQEPRPLG